MTKITREQVANATEVDEMLGTSEWTACVRGTHGFLDAVSLKWEQGTHRGYRVRKHAEMQFRIERKGRSPDDVYEDRYRPAPGCRSGRERNYGRMRSSVGEYEVFTHDLIIDITVPNPKYVVQTYLCVPTAERELHYSKMSFSDRELQYCRIGRFKVRLGRILGWQTGEPARELREERQARKVKEAKLSAAAAVAFLFVMVMGMLNISGNGHGFYLRDWKEALLAFGVGIAMCLVLSPFLLLLGLIDSIQNRR